MQYLFHYNLRTDKFKLYVHRFHTGADVSKYFILWSDLLKFFEVKIVNKFQKFSLVDKMFLKKFIFAMTRHTYKIWKNIIYRNFKRGILKWFSFLLISGKFRRGKACFACAETFRKQMTVRKLEYSTTKETTF